MRRVLERISPVLFVSVVTGGFVITSTLPATADLRRERRDRLHAERPVAASASPGVDFDEYAWIERAGYLAALHEADLAAQAAREAQAAANRVVGSRGGSCNGDVACFLECTRAIESGSSGYQAVSANGIYRGAYQFSQPTWDAAVAGAGHDQYVGVPADQVPADIQDAAAAHLYSVSGNRPWGGRC